MCGYFALNVHVYFMFNDVNGKFTPGVLIKLESLFSKS